MTSARPVRPARPARPARHLLALAAGAALLPAFAQQAQPATEQVIVTGTRAKDRTVLSAAAPIDVLSGEDVRHAAGADGNLAAALQTLLPSFNFPRQSNSSGSDHVRAAQLRGLSPDQVLVLVNGKRRHTTAVVNLDTKVGKGTNPVDFNSIPLNAIQRIEVLRDGAGAQYGSDAIGGVINVILDNAATGSEIEATLGANHTHFAPTGKTLTDGQDAELHAKTGFALGDGGFLRVGAELNHRRPTNRAGLDDVASQIDAGFFDDTPDNRARNGQRNYSAGDPLSRALNLWAHAGRSLDAATAAYGFATFDQRDTQGSAFFRYPDTPQNVKAVYPQGFRPVTTGRNTDVSATGGLQGELAGALQGWSYDASLGWGSNQFDYGLKHSINASLGAASPTAFHLARYEATQLIANADLRRDLALGWAHPATLALGAELRHEGFSTSAGDAASYAIGTFDGAAGAQAGPGLQPGDAVSLSRNISGVYASLSGEPTAALFTEAALRHDQIGGAGGSGKTTGKLSGRYTLATGYAVRATASTNFRAPSLPQSGFSQTVTDRGDGGALTEVRTLPVNSALARSLGAQDLLPESARNLSLGFTAQPLRELTLTLDTYRIDIDNRITLSERVSQGANAYNFFTNAVDTRTRGTDLVASWAQPLAGGTLRSTLASSYNRTTLRRIHDEALIGLETRNTLTNAAPRSRHVLTLDWQGGAWGGLARLTRQGETTRVFDFGDGFVPTQTYAAVWQLDLEGQWQATRALQLAVGGTNITNRYPQRSISDISYFNNFPYDVLSPVGFNGAYFYGRARYTF